MPIARSLLRWYDRAKRDLPWRRQPTPYRTLVSELMLQQTGVATVAPYFVRFLERFPDFAALAAASEDQVTAMWSGLGYYSRARNLRRTAEVVLAEHGGELPRTESELRRLPGVGPYTAAAVAAIAFGARTFALDGNGARVFARLGGIDEPIDRPDTRARLRALGAAEVPRARPGDFTQAVMELGATVCRPRNPRCDVCPVAGSCAALAGGRVDELPRRSARRARPVVRLVCACLTDRDRIWMVRRRAGLLAGTWALPEGGAGGSGNSPSTAAIARCIAAASGARIRSIFHAGAVRHVFTHRDVTAEVFRIDVDGGSRPPAGGRWVSSLELDVLGVSTFARKTIVAALRPRDLPAAGGASPKRDKPRVRP